MSDTLRALTAPQESSGATGPITYPFNTKWEGETLTESLSWYYAVDSYDHATEGTITVYPPTSDHPNGYYTCDYKVHVADGYNWDGGKSTKILGMEITDERLQRLHQRGLAQEYDLKGNSSVRSESHDFYTKSTRHPEGACSRLLSRDGCRPVFRGLHLSQIK